MQLELYHPSKTIDAEITITGSKSETNRLLLLQALYPQIQIENTSNSDDSEAMQHALKTKENHIDIHHAGTAMRFLTAFFATQKGREVVLTGSSRMQERPIKILVDALRKIGADIEYVKEEGYPPLRIKGKLLLGGSVELPANISSQYISALLLIAPKLKQGLQLGLKGEITSLPYIKMSLSLLNRIGVETIFEEKKIIIKPHEFVEKQTQIVESDWSSASYFFSLIAQSDSGKVCLSSYRKDSLQGDSVLMKIYSQLGVKSWFEDSILHLEKIEDFVLPTEINLDLVEAPDIAQTIAVSCYGLGIAANLTGLHTLKIKETDRLIALENELTKLGASVHITDYSLHLLAEQNFQSKQKIATYKDHRMAMAFAPIGLQFPLQIMEADVVTKSYPSFWKDMQAIGFQLIEN